MAAHITIVGVECDPTTVDGSNPGEVMITIQFTNDGDENADVEIVGNFQAPDGSTVWSPRNRDTANVGDQNVVTFRFPPDQINQSGTYTVSVGVEGADMSQGGSCQFTVQ
jgi:hypothetical protein